MRVIPNRPTSDQRILVFPPLIVLVFTRSSAPVEGIMIFFSFFFSDCVDRYHPEMVSPLRAQKPSTEATVAASSVEPPQVVRLASVAVPVLEVVFPLVAVLLLRAPQQLLDRVVPARPSLVS